MSIDWDAWRAGYDSMTFAEMAAFYDEAYRQHPVQQHFDADVIGTALDHLAPRIVVEYGGWTGDLANALLPHATVERWVNIDICREAVEHTVAWPKGYIAHIASDWPWRPPWDSHGTDCMVASHMIEHLSDAHFDAFAASLARFRCLVLAAPLAEHGQTWNGYEGSHILGYGWHEVEARLHSHALVGMRGDTRWYARR